MKIILIRHGKTGANAQKIFSREDEPLSKNAHKDLTALQKRLDAYLTRPVLSIYTSRLLRAVQTAKLLGFKNAVSEPRLTECNFGVLKGLTFLQAAKRFPRETACRIDTLGESAAPLGESAAAHFARTASFLEECVCKNEDRILITHCGAITMAFAWALDSFASRTKFAPENAHFSVFCVTPYT